MPLISCLCPTRNRREFLPESIACFETQTLRDIELLIVWDGEPITDLIPDDPRIRIIESPQSLTLGSKRNFGNRFATGNYIAHWDDDDIYYPERLTVQLGVIFTNKKAVCGFHRAIFTDGIVHWDWKIDPKSSMRCFGNSLFYRRDWWINHQFPNLQTGEDSTFIKESNEKNQLITWDGTGLLLSRNHSKNTFDRSMMNQWETVEGKEEAIRHGVKGANIGSPGRVFAR